MYDYKGKTYSVTFDFTPDQSTLDYIWSVIGQPPTQTPKGNMRVCNLEQHLAELRRKRDAAFDDGLRELRTCSDQWRA